MPLVLPSDYPVQDRPSLAREGVAPLRIGIVNIMPKLEEYEPLLLRRLGSAPLPVEPVFLRLETHVYGSSNAAHLRRFYRSFSRAGHLDGLVLTGAPVEELAFEDVHYWTELSSLL
jgi:homoserine O-succinyltransferase/O-acetyltransferase